jgi:ubiquinone biosynthesis O-methyltransferase
LVEIEGLLMKADTDFDAESWPKVYARWRATEIGVTTGRLETQLMLELVGDVTGRRVLDVGCGDGEFAMQLAGRGAIVTGIDASAAMIDAANERAKQQKVNVSFRVADAQHLPIPDGQFDIVTAVTILCFVDDARPVFREAARVLRPGGLFVIGELGRWSTWAAVRRVRAWLGSRLWRGARFRTANDLRRLAEQAGLAVKAVRGAIFYPRSNIAARLVSPFDQALGRHTTIGAAFVVLAAWKRP